MIGIDTNILTRTFLEDDEIQGKAAQNFLRNNITNKIFIASYVLLEFVWVLKVNKFTRQEIYEAVINLIDNSGFIIGHQDIIILATEKYIKGKADFADYMIIAEGEVNSANKFITFDKDIVREVKNASYP
ncbi:PIN domain-containing protein [Rickettsia sp. Tenjiku01]|uniref:PIN domain-containing protein n=1 Tax=Rickettsia sp. Tenjiku01 TaxID=1736693 RepID=UPI0007DB553A|nr:PIN domain-containing protein [Rickettsia sp. Tenjiku01]